MDFQFFLKLVRQKIINFNELLLKNYKRLKINESEVLVLIELNNLLDEGALMLKTSKLLGRVNLSSEELNDCLESLIKEGYLVIEIETNKNGRQTEIFHLTPLIEKIYMAYLDDYKAMKAQQVKTVEENIVELFENEFKKQISPLEIEIITKWLTEDKFSFDEIKSAMLDAVKVQKLTLNYVDAILIQKRVRQDNEIKYDKNLPPAIEELKKTWKR